MKIGVLGSTGLLGSKVVTVLQEYGHHVQTDHTAPYVRMFDAAEPIDYEYWDRFFYGTDYIVNCIGVIKPVVQISQKESVILINSVFPHRLQAYCSYRNIKLIQISTDCVFAGDKGKYTEESPTDATDLYGKSKALGEPLGAMTFRLSIVGFEPNHKRSLLSWLQTGEGKEVPGYTNHFWNGVTTREAADVIRYTIERSKWRPRVQHIFGNVLSKAQLLEQMAEKWNIRTTVVHTSAPVSVDRTLDTVHKEFHLQMGIPDFKIQLKD